MNHPVVISTPSLDGYGQGMGSPGVRPSTRKPKQCGIARSHRRSHSHKHRTPRPPRERVWKNNESDSSDSALDGMVPAKRQPWLLPGPMVGQVPPGSLLGAGMMSAPVTGMMGGPTMGPAAMAPGPVLMTLTDMAARAAALSGQAPAQVQMETKAEAAAPPVGAAKRTTDLIFRGGQNVVGGEYDRAEATGFATGPATISDATILGTTDLTGAKYPVHLVRCRLGGPVRVGAAPVMMSDCNHDSYVMGSGPVDVHMRGGIWRGAERAVFLRDATGHCIMERNIMRPGSDFNVVDLANSATDVVMTNNTIRPVGARGVLRMVNASGPSSVPAMVSSLGNTVILPGMGWIASPGRAGPTQAVVVCDDRLLPTSRGWSVESKVDQVVPESAVRVLESSGAAGSRDVCVVMKTSGTETLTLPPAHQMRGFMDVYAYGPTKVVMGDQTATVEAGAAARFCPHPDGTSFVAFR